MVLSRLQKRFDSFKSALIEAPCESILDPAAPLFAVPSLRVCCNSLCWQLVAVRSSTPSRRGHRALREIEHALPLSRNGSLSGEPRALARRAPRVDIRRARDAQRAVATEVLCSRGRARLYLR